MAIMPDNIRLTIHTTQYMLHSNNFIHILLNNFAHDSVGGQPTIADQIHFPNIFKNSYSLSEKNYFKKHT